MNIVKRLNYNSPVIISFFVISLLVLLTGTSSYLMLRFTSFSDVNLYLRLFLYPLAHADFNHFINNFLLILVVGPGVEERYGSKTLLGMILITSAVTGIINLLFFTNIGLLGASGIAFMIVILSSYTNAKKGTIPITFILVLGLYIGREILAMTANDNISQLSHILGGVLGAIYCFIIPTGKTSSKKKKKKFENTQPLDKV